MKELFFKISGNIWNEETNFKDEFQIFVKGIDNNHAVMIAKDYLRKNAPSIDGKLSGKIIVEKVEERVI